MTNEFSIFSKILRENFVYHATFQSVFPTFGERTSYKIGEKTEKHHVEDNRACQTSSSEIKMKYTQVLVRNPVYTIQNIQAIL